MDWDTEDELKDLLRRADADASPHSAPDYLSAGVRRLMARRRRRFRATVAATAAAVMLCASAGLWLIAQRGETAISQDDPAVVQVAQEKPLDDNAEIARLRVRIARLEGDTRRREEAILQMQADAEAEREKEQLATRVETLEEITRQIARDVDEAAFVAVFYADLMRDRHGRVEEALATYRDVIRLFPQTPSAQLAKRRLIEIEKPNSKGDEI